MLSLMRLEDRIVYDVSDNSGNDTTADGGDGAGQQVRLLVVDESVAGADTLMEAVRQDGDVHVHVFSYDSQTDSLTQLVADLGAYASANNLDGLLDSIAFLTKGGDGMLQIAADSSLSALTLESDPAMQRFWSEVVGMLADGGRVDLLGSGAAAENGDGPNLVALLEEWSANEFGKAVDFTGSTNATGNGDGADWIMESDGIDIAADYFDATELAAFTGDLTAMNNGNADGADDSDTFYRIGENGLGVASLLSASNDDPALLQIDLERLADYLSTTDGPDSLEFVLTLNDSEGNAVSILDALDVRTYSDADAIPDGDDHVFTLGDGTLYYGNSDAYRVLAVLGKSDGSGVYDVLSLTVSRRDGDGGGNGSSLVFADGLVVADVAGALRFDGPNEYRLGVEVLRGTDAEYNSDSAAIVPLFGPTPRAPEINHIIFLDLDLPNGAALRDAINNPECHVITYNSSTTTLSDLQSEFENAMISSGKEKVTTIAFVGFGQPDTLFLASDATLTSKSLNSNLVLQDFIRLAVESVNRDIGGQINFISSETGRSSTGDDLVTVLEDLFPGFPFAASDDRTGNVDGGNWELELGNEYPLHNYFDTAKLGAIIGSLDKDYYVFDGEGSHPGSELMTIDREPQLETGDKLISTDGSGFVTINIDDFPYPPDPSDYITVRIDFLDSSYSNWPHVTTLLSIDSFANGGAVPENFTGLYMLDGDSTNTVFYNAGNGLDAIAVGYCYGSSGAYFGISIALFLQAGPEGSTQPTLSLQQTGYVDPTGLLDALRITDPNGLTNGFHSAAINYWESGENHYTVFPFTPFDIVPYNRLIVVDTSVEDSANLIEAVRDDATVVTYNSTQDDLTALLAKIQNAFTNNGNNPFTSIAFACNGQPDVLFFASDADLTDQTTGDGSPLRQFFDALTQFVKGSDDGGRIDFLASETVGEDGSGSLLANLMTHYPDYSFGFSGNTTGAGGDWILENVGVDVGSIYFDPDKLADYTGTLDKDYYVHNDHLGDPGSEPVTVDKQSTLGNGDPLIGLNGSGIITINQADLPAMPVEGDRIEIALSLQDGVDSGAAPVDVTDFASIPHYGDGPAPDDIIGLYTLTGLTRANGIRLYWSDGADHYEVGKIQATGDPAIFNKMTLSLSLVSGQNQDDPTRLSLASYQFVDASALFAALRITNTYAQQGTYGMKVDVTTRGPSGTFNTDVPTVAFEVVHDIQDGENRLLVVDKAVDGYNNLVSAARSDGVVVVLYDSRTDDLSALVTAIGDALAANEDAKFSSIGFACLGQPGALFLASDMVLTAETATNAALQTLMDMLADAVLDADTGGRIDLLGSQAGFHNTSIGDLVASLESNYSQFDFTASMNSTGGKTGADWIMESDGTLNVAVDYFTPGFTYSGHLGNDYYVYTGGGHLGAADYIRVYPGTSLAHGGPLFGTNAGSFIVIDEAAMLAALDAGDETFDLSLNFVNADGDSVSLLDLLSGLPVFSSIGEAGDSEAFILDSPSGPVLYVVDSVSGNFCAIARTNLHNPGSGIEYPIQFTFSVNGGALSLSQDAIIGLDVLSRVFKMSGTAGASSGYKVEVRMNQRVQTDYLDVFTDLPIEIGPAPAGADGDKALLVVDTSVPGYAAIRDAAAAGTVVVEYNSANEDLASLQAKLDAALAANNGYRFSTIGFVGYGQPGTHFLASDATLGVASYDSTAMQAFWADVASLVVDKADGGRIDLLGSEAGLTVMRTINDVTGTATYANLITLLESRYGLNFAGSTDATGGGGNWLLESDNVNAVAYYFDANRLGQFTGVLGNAEYRYTGHGAYPDADYFTVRKGVTLSEGDSLIGVSSGNNALAHLDLAALKNAFVQTGSDQFSIAFTFADASGAPVDPLGLLSLPTHADNPSADPDSFYVLEPSTSGAPYLLMYRTADGVATPVGEIVESAAGSGRFDTIVVHTAYNQTDQSVSLSPAFQVDPARITDLLRVGASTTEARDLKVSISARQESENYAEVFQSIPATLAESTIPGPGPGPNPNPDPDPDPVTPHLPGDNPIIIPGVDDTGLDERVDDIIESETGQELIESIIEQNSTPEPGEGDPLGETTGDTQVDPADDGGSETPAEQTADQGDTAAAEIPSVTDAGGLPTEAIGSALAAWAQSNGWQTAGTPGQALATAHNLVRDLGTAARLGASQAAALGQSITTAEQAVAMLSAQVSRMLASFASLQDAPGFQQLVQWVTNNANSGSNLVLEVYKAVLAVNEALSRSDDRMDGVAQSMLIDAQAYLDAATIRLLRVGKVISYFNDMVANAENAGPDADPARLMAELQAREVIVGRLLGELSASRDGFHADLMQSRALNPELVGQR